MPELLQRLEALLVRGGSLTVPLLGSSLVLWYLLALRASRLRRGARGAVASLLPRDDGGEPRGVLGALLPAARQAMDAELDPLQWRELLGRARAGLQAYSAPARALIGAAPLLGLLGTVKGMIETFDSLASMAMFARDGGIAGGISEALITTELGLGIAIPGLVAAQLLERLERSLERDLDALESLVARSLERSAR